MFTEKCVFCVKHLEHNLTHPHMFSQEGAGPLRDGDRSHTPLLPHFPKSPSTYNLIRGSTRCSVCSFVQRGSERALLARASRRWHAASVRVLGGFPESRPEKTNRVNAGSRNKYHHSAARYRDTLYNGLKTHTLTHKLTLTHRHTPDRKENLTHSNTWGPHMTVGTKLRSSEVPTAL